MQFAEEYVYDLDDARRGLIVHELVPEMHTSGPAKCYRERANDDYTGYTVWAASVLLSRWIIEHRDDFAGQRVIELGAGCGLSGLAAAACTTAERVVLSDYPRSTMENLLYNVARNCERVAAGADAEALGGAAPPRGVGGGEPDHLVATLGGAGGPTFTGRDAFRAPSGCLMLLAQLDWDDAATWPREAGGGGAFATFDVILASDLFYRRSYARKVASAALQLLRPGGRLVCVTPTAREGLPVLERMMAAAGFTVAEERVPDEWRVNPLRSPADGVPAPPAADGGASTGAPAAAEGAAAADAPAGAARGVPPVRLVGDDEARTMFPELFVPHYDIAVMVFTQTGAGLSQAAQAAEAAAAADVTGALDGARST